MAFNFEGLLWIIKFNLAAIIESVLTINKNSHLILSLSLCIYICVCVCDLVSLWEICYYSSLLLLTQKNTLALQVMYCLPGFWCSLCRFLYCAGMHHWYCCLLLSSVYHCASVCSCRPGKSCSLALFKFSCEMNLVPQVFVSFN
jgi:hypothetical protein